MNHRPNCYVISLWILGLLFSAFEENALWAQADNDNLNQTRPNESLPVDPSATFALQDAQAAIQKSEWEEALTILQRIIELPEDQFVSIRDASSLKQVAFQHLSRIPPAGRAQYERLHGAVAQELFRQGAQDVDAAGWREAVRLYFHTESGLLSAKSLAMRLQDDGDHGAASRLYQQLLDDPVGWKRFAKVIGPRAVASYAAVGNSVEAVNLMKRLRERFGESFFPNDQQLLQPAAEQSPHDDNQREIYTVGAPVWSIPLLDKYDSPATEHILALQSQLDQLQKDLLEKPVIRRAIIPAGTPMVFQDRVIFHGIGMPKSLRAPNGKLVSQSGDWVPIYPDKTLEQFLKDWDGGKPYHRLYLGQRAWRDRTLGSMSTDSERVYVVRNGGMLGAVDPMMPIRTVDHHRFAPWPDNELRAYRLQGGKLEWVIGGARSEAGDGDDLSGLYFLGPPLPYQGHLYCLVEDRGQVQLLVLDPSTPYQPSVLWRQPLYNPAPDLTIEYSEERRTSGLRPVINQGVLLCPTASGAMIAVDLIRRELAWVSSYYIPQMIDPRARWALLRARRTRSLNNKSVALDRLLNENRWHVVNTFVHGGRVVTTAPESDELICLDVSTGKILWRRSREDGLYLAGLWGEFVLVVAQSGIHALQIDNGVAAWDKPIATPPPSGTGLMRGNLYWLPLVTGEIATIDLKRRAIRIRLPVYGEIPGNLVEHAGRVVFQSGTRIVGFRSETEIRGLIADRLRQNPQDPLALSLRGQMKLATGEEEAGLNDLRSSLEQKNDPQARTVLITALLDRMRSDFKDYRFIAEELESLVKGQPQEREFRKLYAVELKQAGELTLAMRQLLALSEAVADSRRMVPIEPSLLAREDRWIRSEVQDIWSMASETDLLEIEEFLERRLEMATEDPNAIDLLRKLVDLFPTSRTAIEARLRLVPLIAESDPLRAEQLLLPLLENSDPSTMGRASAMLAARYLEDRKPDWAAPLLDRLRSEFASTIVVATPEIKQTGDEFAASLMDNERYSELFQSLPEWSRTEIRIEKGKPGRGHRVKPMIPHFGRQVSRLPAWRFQQNGYSPTAYDLYGNFRWRTRVRPVHRAGSGIDYSMTSGHVVLLVSPGRFDVINAYNTAKQGQRDVTYGAELADALYRPAIGRVQQTRPGLRRPLRVNPADRNRSRYLGGVGPLVDGMLCYQKESEVLAVDALSGAVHWKRANLPHGCEILADQQHVVLKPPNSNKVIVLRASDGRLVRELAWPANVVRSLNGAEWGCLILSQQELTENKTVAYRMIDLTNGKPAWERVLPSGTTWKVVDGSDIAFLSPQGQLQIVDFQSGTTLTETTIPHERELISFVIQRDRNQYIILTREKESPRDPEILKITSTSSDQQPVEGVVCAVRRTGDIRWSKPLSGLFFNPDWPPNWPVLVLTARVQKTGSAPPAERQIIEKEHHLVISKQTGEILFDEEGANQRNAPSWTTDASESTIMLHFGFETLRILCRTEPESNESSDTEQDASQPDR